MEFIAEAKVRGVVKAITVKVSPPHIPIKKNIRGKGLVNTEDPNQEYRLLFYWIKSKIEAVTWGLSTIEREFLSVITTALPDGRNVSVGDVVEGLIAENKLPSLPFLGERTDNKAAAPRIIDV